MIRIGIALLALVLVACGPSHPGPVTPTRANTNGAASSTPTGAPDVQACRDAPTIEPNVTVRASTTGRPDLFHASCGYGAASPDAVYRFHIDQPSHIALRVMGGYDTVLSLRTSCIDGDTEIACNDDAPDERHSAIEADVSPGDYFAVVDGYESHHAGFYSLTLTTVPRENVHMAAGIARISIGVGATIEHSNGTPGISGTVLFAKRHFTPHGLTRATTDAPAPHFVVEAVNSEGHALATTETNDQGVFHLDLTPGPTVRVRVVTRTTYLGNDIRVVSDPGTELPYEISTRPFTIEGGERITLRADVGGVEPAGAFNILSQFVRYLPYVQRGFGHPLAPLYAFWRRGNNSALPQGEITAFLLDYHRHEGSYALQIQGGAPGHEDESDSDQFDDPVILHEFTHFVVHTMAGHYSVGGLHQDAELHFPGQALDEGAASAMGCAVVADSQYWDTAGLEPTGEVLVSDDSESMPLPDHGIGSQNTAQTLIWDLADGSEGIPDRDNDGVSIGLTGVMRVYASFHDDPVAFPGIHTILERAVSMNLITIAQASRLVRQPVNQGFVFPLPAADQWPVDLALPSTVQGVVDGHTQPAPSGGRNVPVNGFDAIRTYRVRVTRRGMLYLDLDIQGAGTHASGTDLDLQLFTRNLELVGHSDSETPHEYVHLIVQPGTYIVFVRDGDPTARPSATTGNRAHFTLHVRQSDEFH